MPKQTARAALSSDWFERAVRFGHAAKGVVFGMIGVLAARLVLGARDETPDFPGALEALADQPLDGLFLFAIAVGWWGHAARGAIFVVAGFFGVKAAVRYDPEEAGGFSRTLERLAAEPWGDAALIFMALGLMSFGLYSLLLAVHRHIPDPGETAPEDRLP